MKRFLRGATIVWVVFRYGLDGLVLDSFQKPWLRLLARVLSIGRNLEAPRGQRLVHRFGGQAAAVPAGDGFHGAWQAAHDFRVFHAFVQQQDDRQDEDDKEEQQQRQDQALGLEPVDAFGTRQLLLERQSGEFSEGNGSGHRGLQRHRDKTPSPKTGEG